MNDDHQTGDPGVPPIIGEGRPRGPTRRRKRPLWVAIAIGIGALAVLVLSPVGGVFIGIGYTRIIEGKLRKPEIYEPTARTLATYCQSDQSLFPPYLSYAWLPERLARLGHHPHGIVRTNTAAVEMGGGFYHYGYRLQLDEAASTPATNVWHLSLYREGSQDTHLMTLAWAATQHLGAASLEKLATAGFDEVIKGGRTGACLGKVMLQLRFGNTAGAARTCEEWVRLRPAYWLPRFTRAHVRCRLGEVEAASADFEGWVKQNKNFANCIYLALFQFREARTNDAIKAVRLSMDQPFIEPLDSEANKFYLGQNGMLIAYIQGDYDLALAMCDKMLSGPGQDKWWLRKVLKLKAAVQLMRNDRAGAIRLMREAEASGDADSFSAQSIGRVDRAFRAALEKGDLASVRDFRNCVDELDSWFSPFETDETGIHGSGLNVPNPYPKSWATDTMRPAPEQ